MTGALNPTHWLIIIGLVVLLFGAKKLPDAARGVGKSLRILKAETAALSGDDQKDDSQKEDGLQEDGGKQDGEKADELATGQVHTTAAAPEPGPAESATSTSQSPAAGPVRVSGTGA